MPGFSADSAELIRRTIREVLLEPAQRSALSPPGGTGALYIGQTTSSITARSGTTPGSGTVDLYDLDTTLAKHQNQGGTDVEVTAYNLSTTAVATSRYVMLLQDQISGNYWVVWEDC